MVYLSQLKNQCVFDTKNVCIGKLIDLVFTDGKDYAEITHLIYLDDEQNKKKVSWKYVKEFKEEGKGKNGSINVNLNQPEDDISLQFTSKKDSLLGVILDKQVVDINGVKVVRVNDVILGKVENKFSVVAVAVGAASFARRLGFFGKATTKTKIKENIIPWKSVERLEPEFHDIHLKMQKDKIEDLHPEDIADIMEDLSHTERILIFDSLDDRKAAKTLIEAEEEVQDSVLKGFKIKKIKELLENIPADQAADIISLMPNAKADSILKSIKKESSSKIRKILDYVPNAVGSIMKTDFIAVPVNYTARQTINILRKLKPAYDKVYHLYVLDRRKLVGVLSIRALLIASPQDKIEDFMLKDLIFLKDRDTKETAARLMARYDLFVLPVVDQDGILRGIVKADDVLDEYLPERLQREKFLPLKLRKK